MNKHIDERVRRINHYHNNARILDAIVDGQINEISVQVGSTVYKIPVEYLSEIKTRSLSDIRKECETRLIGIVTMRDE